MVNAKTANNKRKSFGGAGGKSPKLTKLETSIQTPGKGKGNATPGKQNQSPKNVAQQNNAKSPQQKTPRGTPFKNQQQASGKKPGQNAPKTPKQTPAKEQQELEKKTEQNILKVTLIKEDSGKKNKRSSESESEGSPPKKIKMFGGTGGLQESQGPKNKKGKGPVQNVKIDKQDGKKKRKGQFSALKEKIKGGANTAAVAEIDQKIKLMEERKELTKTGTRKLKFLLRARNALTGEQVQSKHLIGEKKEVKKPVAKKAAQKKVEKAEEDEESSAGSDYVVEAVVKPGKVGETGEEESDEEGEEVEEESGEDEEDSDEEEAEDEEDESEEEEVGKLVKIQKGKQSNAPQSGTPNLEVSKPNKPIESKNKKSRYVLFVGNIPYNSTKEEISNHFNKVGPIRDIRIITDKGSNKPRGFSYVEFEDETTYQKALSMHHTFIRDRRINVLYTQGGKKKGPERKNEVKAKNFKLQAMRRQGQLAGSVKQNQKRAFRRGAKKEVNGS